VCIFGVQLKNEAKISDMCHIVNELTKYVPYEEVIESLTVDGEDFSCDKSKLFQLLLFGDQLTIARACSAIVLRCFHPTALSKLKRFVPTIVDWHARQCLCVSALIVLISQYMQLFRQFGTDCITVSLHVTKAHYFSYGMF